MTNSTAKSRDPWAESVYGEGDAANERIDGRLRPRTVEDDTAR